MFTQLKKKKNKYFEFSFILKNKTILPYTIKTNEELSGTSHL